MISVYPGSFDPPTNGHMDIITRASKFSDKLYVAVLNNSSKNVAFSVSDRLSMLSKITEGLPNVEVVSFSGLLVDFAAQAGASHIIRGLRAVMDFEYEFQMALTNRSLDDRLETLFIPTSVQYLYLSSSIVKEVLKYGGNISHMVPEPIEEFIKRSHS